MDKPTPHDGDSDRTLVRAAAGGDERAFARLVARYASSVRQVAARELHDDVLADEAMQETFVRLFRSLGSIEVGESLFPWLRRVAINIARDLQRRFQRDRRSIPIEHAPTRHIASPNQTDATLLARERAKEIRTAVDELQPDRREAVLLRFWKGLTYDEVAEVTGVPPGTVASRIHRALQDLGRRLETTDLARLGAGPEEKLDDRS